MASGTRTGGNDNVRNGNGAIQDGPGNPNGGYIVIIRTRLAAYDAASDEHGADGRNAGGTPSTHSPAQGFVAAWVGGSYAHGVADAQSDIDLHAIILPAREAILLGEDMGTKAFREPDLKVSSPLALMRQLAKGMPNALEKLALPADCDLIPDGPLSHWRRYARALVCPATLRAAMGNVGANLRQLDAPPVTWDGRKTRKVQAETLRLLHCIRHTLDGEAWPCRLPDDETALVRGVRIDGGDIDAMRRECERLEALAERLGDGDAHTDTVEARAELRHDLLDLYGGVVERAGRFGGSSREARRGSHGSDGPHAGDAHTSMDVITRLTMFRRTHEIPCARPAADASAIPRLRGIGRFGGFDLYYNPLNQRIIAERKSDLATVLFDCPSLDVARRWDADDGDVRSLQAHLRASRILWAGLDA